MVVFYGRRRCAGDININIEDFKKKCDAKYLGSIAVCKECQALYCVAGLQRGKVCLHCFGAEFVLPGLVGGVTYLRMIFNACSGEVVLDLRYAQQWTHPLSNEVAMSPKELDDLTQTLIQKGESAKHLIQEGTEELERLFFTKGEQ